MAQVQTENTSQKPCLLLPDQKQIPLTPPIPHGNHSPAFCSNHFFFFFFLTALGLFAARGHSLVAASGGYSSLRCAGFSSRWLLQLQSMGSRRVGFSSCGTRALERRLSSCGSRTQLLRGMWDLPGPGLEPVSPALAGGFLTTAPPGKPQESLSCFSFCFTSVYASLTNSAQFGLFQE